MQQAEGTVVSSGDGVALVEVNASTCARCAAGKGCGAGVFGQSTRTRQLEARLERGVVVQPGDQVRLSLADDSVLRAAGVVYGWPLVGALLSAAVANLVFSMGDAGAVLMALAGLGSGIVVARWHAGRQECLSRFTPVVRAVDGRF